MALTKGRGRLQLVLPAMAHWQKGDKDQARNWFDKAVAWTEEKAPNDAGLRQFWAEAAELLGQPGPDAAGAGSPAASRGGVTCARIADRDAKLTASSSSSTTMRSGLTEGAVDGE